MRRRTGREVAWLAVRALLGVVVACESVPSETSPPPGGRELAFAGVIRGTVVYSGPHPCSSQGHVVGGAILFVFDRRNLPPPNGTANTPVNFGVVSGDVLFGGEPRNQGKDVYCPLSHGITDTITASATFEISPLDAGSYIVEAFYDYTGDFSPAFKFRELPERGDIAGGDLDTVDAVKNSSNPNFQPHFLPVDIGIPQPLPPGSAPGTIPPFALPPNNGFVADNVTVTVGSALPTTRPYFYAEGLSVSFDPANPTAFTTASNGQSSAQAATPGTAPPGATNTDPNYEPILTIPQDLEIFAPPITVNATNLNNYESRLPHLRLDFGVPMSEVASATATEPFHFQIPAQGGGFAVWQNADRSADGATWTPQSILEGLGVPDLWPLVVLTKLADDSTDTAYLETQGSPTEPVVVIQGITLLASTSADSDSLVSTAAAAPGLFDMATGLPALGLQDHLTALIRPSAICFDSLFDPNALDKRGTLVLPYSRGLSADLPTGTPDQAMAPPSALTNPQVLALTKGGPTEGCLPTGRYAINIVYPDGQAWTVPNEAGACSGKEGATDFVHLTCLGQGQARPVLRSQGPRGVVEVVRTTNAAHCQGAHAVPPACLPHG